MHFCFSKNIARSRMPCWLLQHYIYQKHIGYNKLSFLCLQEYFLFIFLIIFKVYHFLHHIKQCQQNIVFVLNKCSKNQQLTLNIDFSLCFLKVLDSSNTSMIWWGRITFSQRQHNAFHVLDTAAFLSVVYLIANLKVP